MGWTIWNCCYLTTFDLSKGQFHLVPTNRIVTANAMHVHLVQVFLPNNTWTKCLETGLSHFVPALNKCMESILYTSDNAVHSNLPVSYYLPVSHFSSEILAANSLEEDEAKMTSEFFFQPLSTTTSAASGFSRCLGQWFPPALRLPGWLSWSRNCNLDAGCRPPGSGFPAGLGGEGLALASYWARCIEKVDSWRGLQVKWVIN